MRQLVRIGAVVGVGGLIAALFAQSDPAEKTARSILETKCAACHGPARMSDLDVRDRATILKGGKRGPAIVPGKADESLLYQAVRRQGELKMPPGKAALTAAEVDAIRDWINTGAKWSTGASRNEIGRSWWSFKKPVRPPTPPVKDAVARAQSDRRVHSCETGSQGAASRARSRPPDPGAARLLRSPRTSAHTGTGGRIRQRPVARCVRKVSRSPARFSALRRAVGPPLAGPRALRRYVRVRDGPLLHHRLAVSRLRDRVVQPRQAIHDLRAGADRRRRVVAHQHGVGRLEQTAEGEGGERPPADRHQPVYDRILPHRVHVLWRPVSRRMVGGCGGHGGSRVPGTDGGMRPLPRS